MSPVHSSPVFQYFITVSPARRELKQKAQPYHQHAPNEFIVAVYPVLRQNSHFGIPAASLPEIDVGRSSVFEQNADKPQMQRIHT